MQNNGCILFFLTILLLFALIAAITIASFKEYNFKKIDSNITEHLEKKKRDAVLNKI
jgi:hypothetical protein